MDKITEKDKVLDKLKDLNLSIKKARSATGKLIKALQDLLMEAYEL